jgi:hypothetical protein
LSLALVALAGCGGGAKTTPATKPFEVVAQRRSSTDVAACLNARSFLVQADGRRQVGGSSPGGINFAVTFFADARAARIARARHHYSTMLMSSTADVAIDDSGNPPAHRGGRPMRLEPVDLHTIIVCIEHG